jgi:hypothetical protein
MRCPKCGAWALASFTRCPAPSCDWAAPDASIDQGPTSSANDVPSTAVRAHSVPTELGSVIVTDIRMPFTSMVTFMVKWAVASIPATVILIIVLILTLAILSAVFGGLLSVLLR